MVGFLLKEAEELLHDRMDTAINTWIDLHRHPAMIWQKTWLLWLLNHPVFWPVAVICGILLFASLRDLFEWTDAARQVTASNPPKAIIAGSSLTISVPSRTGFEASQSTHNVHFVGFNRIQIDPDSPEPTFAALCFQNVPITGQALGEFRCARLKAEYYDAATGQKIAEVFPVRWHEFMQPTVDLSFVTRCALIASFIGNKWTADRMVEIQPNPAAEYEFEPDYRPESTDLPLGAIRIVATLFGEKNVSIAPIRGILTLDQNGVVHFKNS